MSDKKDNSLRGWIHFGIAAGLLTVTTFGFNRTIKALEWVTQKDAVPWPESVIVDPDTFRWENLPTRVGDRYILAEDGELSGELDGIPDGEIIPTPDIMASLKIGTSWDKQRVASRRSNWYVIRIYRDTKRDAYDPLRYWQVEVYYYTGGLDLVPHVPERCLVAAGATLVDSVNVNFDIPQAQSPWDEPLRFRRARYEVSDRLKLSSRKYTQYYVFSLNGNPESSWERVRFELAKPWVRHCYFAKIQFAPRGHTPNTEEADRAARELMNYFLPVVLQSLPMPSDVAALKSADPDGK